MQDTQRPSERPAISAIITSHFEEKSIGEFFRRLNGALESLGRSYEIIMINDGSTDKTFERMQALFEQNENVSAVLDFSKNSGQLAAMTAGVCHARGDAILFIDSDLQLDPEELPLLVEEFDKGYDLVTGCRKERHDAFTRIIPSKIANMIMRRVSDSDLTDFGCTFKLYNARILRAFDLGPFNLYNTARVISRIQHYKEIPVTHHARKYGKSGWTFRKLWKFNMDNIVHLSMQPFQMLATGCVLFATLLCLRVLLAFSMDFKVLPDVSNGLLLNVILISLLSIISVLCIIGELTIRTFVTTERIPGYIIRRKLER